MSEVTFAVFLSWATRTLEDRIEDLSSEREIDALSKLLIDGSMSTVRALLPVNRAARRTIQDTVAWEMLRLSHSCVNFAIAGPHPPANSLTRLCFAKASRKSVQITIGLHTNLPASVEDATAKLRFRGVSGECTIEMRDSVFIPCVQPKNPEMRFVYHADQWLNDAPDMRIIDLHWFVTLRRKPKLKRKRE